MSGRSSRDIVLITSLGRSPSVVTETVDALIERNMRPKRVYVVTTADSIVQEKCIPLLRDEFRINYRDIDFIVKNISNDDIYDEKDNEEFMRLVAGILDEEICRGSRIFMCLAGGRKTMSAAMAILGWIYGADAIIHVLVPSELEKKGNINVLLKLSPEEKAEILHPSDKRVIFFSMSFPLPLDLATLQPSELVKKLLSL